jgi:hypothetical protein
VFVAAKINNEKSLSELGWVDVRYNEEAQKSKGTSVDLL